MTRGARGSVSRGEKRMNAYISAPAGRPGRDAGCRRGRRPGPAKGGEVASPDRADVPDWSGPTLAALAELTSLQRSFVEWVAVGLTGAEAYRRASRRTGTLGPNARNNAAQLARHPRVRAAVDAALGDRNVVRRVSRQWLFQRLSVALDRCEAADGVRAASAVARIIRTIAELQGDLGRWRRPPPEPAEGADAAPRPPARRGDRGLGRPGQARAAGGSPEVDPAARPPAAAGGALRGSTDAPPAAAGRAERVARAEASGEKRADAGAAESGPPVPPGPPARPGRVSAADYARPVAGGFRPPFMGVP